MIDASVKGRKQGWLAWLLLIPILIAAAVVGFFVFVVVFGLVLFAAAVLIARLWWLRRKMRQAGVDQTLEGVYVVVNSPTTDDNNAEREVVSERGFLHRADAGADHPQRVVRDKDVR